MRGIQSRLKEVMIFQQLWMMVQYFDQKLIQFDEYLVERFSLQKQIEAQRRVQRGMVDVVNKIVVVSATLFIGIIVISMIGEAMPEGEELMLEDTMDSLESMIGSSFELAILLPLVLAAGALLYWVSGFGQNGRGMN